MTARRLKKLTIERFRGAVQSFALQFDDQKPITLIYGENGSGKSTICDALDLLGNGVVGSLANRGLGKTNPYWHSAGKTARDVAVTLETDDGACRGTLRATGVSVTPPDKRPRVTVLRRSQITALLEAKPADRYAAISRFVDVSGIESSEAALSDALRHTQAKLEIALARVQENRDTILQFWTKAGKPRSDALKWAAEESRRDPNALDLEMDALGYLQHTFSRLTEYPAKFKSAQEKVAQAQDAHTMAARALEESVQRASAGTAETVALLEAAQVHLTRHPAPAVCPLCGSAERVNGLVERVRDQLESFTALRQVQARVNTTSQALQLAAQQNETLVQLAQEHARAFEVARANAQLPSDTRLPAAPLPDDPTQWDGWLRQNYALAMQWQRAAAERLDRKQFLETLQAALETLNANTLAYQELEALLPRLEQTLQVVRAERRTFTDAALARIAVQVGQMYERIHPGEGLDQISLLLDPKKRASLEIGVSFGELRDTPPQAYFSESHLDTLGLCVFYALAKMDAPDEKILALDDILGSVDEAHVERVARVIFDQAVHFQHCIITTHHRPWRERFRAGDALFDECHLIELGNWHTTRGMAAL